MSDQAELPFLLSGFCLLGFGASLEIEQNNHLLAVSITAHSVHDALV